MTEDESGLGRFVSETIAGRYRIEKLLGEGGMGAVFKADHLGLHMAVAVKLMHAEIGRDPQVSARFDREAQSASRLDHPNCVRVTDFGTWEPPDGSPPAKFMVMQYLDGFELGKLLGSPLSPERTIELGLQILAGLAHAHEHGIVHRDIKPENVFVTKDHAGQQTLKIVDFGLAKIVSGEGSKDQMTKAGLVFGTPRYMSPEQAAGGKIDERTDLYSVGIMLYEMLAGQPPFDAEDLVGLLRAQIIAEPPPLPTSVPTPLAAVVMRLLQKSAPDRYETARQAHDVLDELLAHLRDGAPAPVVDTSSLESSGGLRIGVPSAVALEHSLSSSSRFPSPGTVTSVPAPLPPVRSGVTQPGFSLGSRRTLLTAVGGIGALGVILMIATSGDEPARAETATPTAAAPAAPDGKDDDVNLAAAVAQAIPSLRAPDAKIEVFDALMADKQWGAAQKHLEPLLDEYPRDPQLLWRRGKLAARRKDGKADALAAYGEAVTEDPSLLDDAQFTEELDVLLFDAKLRDDALDLALQKLGAHGHEFLLELAALDSNVLGYVDRHRVLDAVAELPDHAEFVNPKLHLALDLWQAPQALDPCRAFTDALGQMKFRPDPYFVGTLEQVEVPNGRPANKEDPPPVCDGASDELTVVRNLHTEKFADAPRTVPADYEKKGRKKRSGGGRRRPIRNFFRGLSG